jgi:hypothetical protein
MFFEQRENLFRCERRYAYGRNNSKRQIALTQLGKYIWLFDKEVKHLLLYSNCSGHSWPEI